MIAEIFNLDFGRWEIIVLSLFPAIINFAIFLYTSFFLPQNETTRSFSIFVFILGLWQITEGFIKMSQTAEAGLEWSRISGIFIVLVISTGISFVLDYTKWKKRIPPNLLFFLIFFPTLICSCIIVARLDKYSAISSDQWHWIINPVPSIFTGIIYMWVSLGGVLMLALLLIHSRTVRAIEVKRKKAILLVIGFSVPVIGGIIAEVIIPFFLGKDSIPITNSLLTVFSMSTLVAIRKYRMFEYSPNYLWGRIKDSMSEGVLIVDNNGNIVFANKGFCSLIGYRFDEIENKNINEFLNGQVDARGAKIESLGEVRITAKNGAKIWVMISGSPYLDEVGNTIGMIILFANINLLKESEENLRLKEENLSLAVKELTGLEERLRATNHDLKTFIYRSSHDLRTPLTSLLGLIEVGNIEITDKTAREYFGYIGDLTTRMDQLLLTLIKVMSVKDHAPELKSVDTGQLVDEIMTSLKHNEGFDSIKFHIENNGAETVTTDRTLLQSILLNLTENAIRYRKNGMSDPQITVRFARVEKSIRIEVIDNGIGIREQDQTRVFDMFFRATTLSKGSGLGLYLVKTSVERLGGHVYLESQEEGGAKFAVLLPG